MFVCTFIFQSISLLRRYRPRRFVPLYFHGKENKDGTIVKPFAIIYRCMLPSTFLLLQMPNYVLRPCISSKLVHETCIVYMLPIKPLLLLLNWCFASSNWHVVWISLEAPPHSKQIYCSLKHHIDECCMLLHQDNVRLGEPHQRQRLDGGLSHILYNSK